MGASGGGEKNDAVLALDVGNVQSSEEEVTMSAWKAYWVCFMITVVLKID
jgi:hypothetical protein